MSDERPVSWLLVERGWAVVAADGTEVGRVDEVVGDPGSDIFDGLTVTTSALSRPRYVAAERVGAITPGRVELTIAAEEAASLAPYEQSATANEALPGSASPWQRLVGWFRGLRRRH